MARCKMVDMSPRLLPVDLHAQLVHGSFAHALHHLVDRLDLSAFNTHYRNDEVGASAHAPAMLFNVVLLRHSEGMIGSRAIGSVCRDYVPPSQRASIDPRTSTNPMNERVSGCGFTLIRIKPSMQKADMTEGNPFFGEEMQPNNVKHRK